jgi:SpoVK/Ycf46/Vps4 family AAA+-type ATPase
MQKKDVINLIKYYTENNDIAFRNEAYKIAKIFDEKGDYQLSEYIMSLLSDANTFVPQMLDENMSFFTKIENNSKPLPLPEEIKDDIVGVINAIGHNVGINKFLFEGAPGTGKTETVKQIARILDRQLFSVEFDTVIDSKLGQTSKNVISVFNEISNISNPSKVLILFDEIDSIALDRVNSNDLREMGRVTSTILRELDKLNDEIVLIATTNLFSSFDKALIRRFDSVINFNRYSREDLIDVAESILNSLLDKFKFASRNMRLFKKIIGSMEEIPCPGDLKNMIKTSLAFSNSSNEFDYMKKLLINAVGKEKAEDIRKLYTMNFTIREIEILTGISKSQISRELKE